MVNPESKRHAGLASAISLGLRGHSTCLGRRPNDRQRNEAVLLEAQFSLKVTVAFVATGSGCRWEPQHRVSALFSSRSIA